jgi:hypothetical protein
MFSACVAPVVVRDLAQGVHRLRHASNRPPARPARRARRPAHALDLEHRAEARQGRFFQQRFRRAISSTSLMPSAPPPRGKGVADREAALQGVDDAAVGLIHEPPPVGDVMGAALLEARAARGWRRDARRAEALRACRHGALDGPRALAVDHAEEVVGPFRPVAAALVAERHSGSAASSAPRARLRLPARPTPPWRSRGSRARAWRTTTPKRLISPSLRQRASVASTSIPRRSPRAEPGEGARHQWQAMLRAHRPAAAVSVASSARCRRRPRCAVPAPAPCTRRRGRSRGRCRTRARAADRNHLAAGVALDGGQGARQLRLVAAVTTNHRL